MARTGSWKYRPEVLARFGEITVVDTGYHREGEPIGSGRLTRLDPVLVGKAVREHAVPRPDFTMDFRTYSVDRMDDRLAEATGASGQGNLVRTGASIHIESDSHEARFWGKQPFPSMKWDDSSSIRSGTALSSRLPAPSDRTANELVGDGDPLLIAPWRDPEMLGHAILTMFRMSRGPYGKNAKPSVLDRPDVRRRTALHRAALEGDLDELPPAGRRTRRKLDTRDTDGATPLMLACASDHTPVVERLLGLGANPRLIDNEGRSPLHHAAESGNTGPVSLLLAHGIPPSPTDWYGETPLHAAAERGHVEVVRQLLEAGADPQVQDEMSGATPLHRAGRGGWAAVVRALVDAGAPIDAPNESGRTALHVAAGYNHAGAVRELIDLGAGVNRRDDDGETPLHRPAFYGHAECTSLLLEAGADTAFSDAEDGNTPLHVATSMNRTGVVAMLLDSGADIEIPNRGGLTPLDIALTNCRTFSASPWGGAEHNAETAELLLDRGASLDPMRIPVGDRHALWPHLSPRGLLRDNGDLEYLLLPELPESIRMNLPPAVEDYSAASNVVWTSTILHDAVWKQMPGMVRRLLEAGMPPATGSHTRYILHVAVEVGNKEIASILLEHGADIESPLAGPWKKKGEGEQRGDNQAFSAMTALDWAKYRRQPEMYEFLLDCGAIPMQWDEEQWRWVEAPELARRPLVGT